MQRLTIRLSAVLLCLLLAACAGRVPRALVELPPLRLAPASLPTPLALQQQLHFRFGRHERDLEALLEADAQQVQLAVQAMGQTGVRLQWDGRQLSQQRAPWLPQQVRAERVLDDLQFALWPTQAIAAVLPAGWQVTDDGHLRSLSRDGQVWLQLQRREGGSLELDNRAEGYSLRIESITADGPTP
ncbi:MAG TPA: DUF3261 domain-containing protein [Stenotrophomonas sp.]|uniref:DUF3261 domain-containing protein n=1 Tax=unclassified Stenotrophomonas TaxID=196198 RepID=UPI000DE624D9|nr:DUF3261 domain-containing protein [Stenotrophomonas sp. SPM]PWB27093.1 DUF3261 domain-containing protein [Stenotrophomonas sp. SPM]HCR32866.1 DUF3261 domain-containing protein [Stenotrophomonas sp.]